MRCVHLYGKDTRSSLGGSACLTGVFSGNHQCVANGVRQVDGHSGMTANFTCTLDGGMLQKRNGGFATTLSGRKLPLQLTLNLMPDNSVPPYVSLAPLKLRPLCCSSE